MPIAQPRATGANTFFRADWESTYGIKPGGNWTEMPCKDFRLARGQPLQPNPLLGQGRDPVRPQRGAIDVTGPTTVPIDKRYFGRWLTAMYGAVQSSVQVGARGYLEFDSQPAADTTIELNGVTWTFKSSGAAGNETNLQADLQATLDQLVTDLNGSGDAGLTPATYSRLGDRLLVQHDTADASGNAYSLATAIADARVSGATLVGGGLYKHVWHSGASALPAQSIERYHSDWKAGSNRFRIYSGVLANTMTIGRNRDGLAEAEIACIAQNAVRETATQAGTPVATALDQFSQFKGTLLVDGVGATNLTSGSIALGNNLDVVPGLRPDGLIEGADPGETQVGFEITGRFSDNELQRAVEAEAAVEIRTGFFDRLDGAELEILMHQVDLPDPRDEVTAPGGIEVTYSTQGSQDPTGVGRAVTVSLWNDVAGGYPLP